MTAVEFLESQYNFNKQLFPSDFEQAKEMEDKKLQENWEECEIRMKQSIYWNNKETMKTEQEEQYNNMLSMLQETYRRLEHTDIISLRKQIKEVLTFKSE